MITFHARIMTVRAKCILVNPSKFLVNPSFYFLNFNDTLITQMVELTKYHICYRKKLKKINNTKEEKILNKLVFLII